MRARNLWAAALASLLCGLALGLSALAGAAEPQSDGARDLRGPAPGLPGSSWSVVASMPQHLYGAAGASNGTYAYAAGGYSMSTDTTLDTFYRYNPVNERWDTYPPPMPAALELVSAVYYPTTNSIYVFGGKNGGAFSNATWIFDITANTWSSVATMPAPRAAMAAGYNSANGRIYLVGGYDASGPQTTTWEYVPGSNTFLTNRAPIPHPVAGAASGVIAGHLYVAGGHDASSVLNMTWDYSIGADTWTARTDMPTPTDAPGSAVASGKLWAFGGENPSSPSATTVAYDPATNSWTSGPSMNIARAQVAGAAIGNTLVAAGGDTGSTSTAATEVLASGSASCADPVTTYSENFDGVTPPALPAGWTATNDQGPPPFWVTSNSGMPTPPSDTPPNAAFVDNPQVVSDKRLESPSIPIVTSAAQLTFRNNYYTETTFDGGVLEISINGGEERHSLILIVSMRQPGAPAVVSLPSRQRSTTFCPAAEGGRIATVVMKPLFELPVQARRPCSGLPLKSESVPL
jgi:N-acetylneuraminic acid mutarotase